MHALPVLCWVSALVVVGLGVAAQDVRESCQSRSWGDNACSLGGGLSVTSVPNNLELSTKNCNTFHNKSAFQKQPVVTLSDAESEEKYSLVMVDPDAPGLSPDTYYLHWIVANIVIYLIYLRIVVALYCQQKQSITPFERRYYAMGEDFKKGNFKSANIITPYAGPAPPPGSGSHRYMLLVYRMRPGTRVAQQLGDAQRYRFHLGEWAHKYDLCGPVAGFQYRTSFSGDP